MNKDDAAIKMKNVVSAPNEHDMTGVDLLEERPWGTVNH